MMRVGDGWVDWKRFSRAAGKTIRKLRSALGYTPRLQELRLFRHQWLISAAYHHHVSYLAVLRRLRIPRPPRRRRPRRPAAPPDWQQRQSNGFVARHYWQQPEHHLKVLRQFYADHLAWGTMPPSTEVDRRHGGFARHFLRAPGGWPRAAKGFNLLTVKEGRRQRLRCAMVEEALSFFELHHCWPHSRQVSYRLRHYRWSHRRTWDSVFNPDGLHPRVMEQLLAIWQQHYEWAKNYGPDSHRTFCLVNINRLIGTIRQVEPFGRSSP